MMLQSNTCATTTTITETTISSLPSEIILDILSRLCIQDLSPCRFVRKDWYDIIKDPVFVDSHHSGIDRDDPTFTVVHHENWKGKENLFLINNKRTAKERMEGSLGACLRKPNFSIVGSSNGLLCLEYDTWTFIMNPITKEIISLPRAPGASEYKSNYRFWQTGAFGFAYDATTKTYKVVQTWYFGNCGGDEIPILVCDIHSIGSGKWRRREILDANNSYTDRNVVFVNNALHWKIRNQQFENHVCVFDVGAETFTRFKNLPKYHDTVCPMYNDVVHGSLGTIKGFLAFVAQIREEFLVWVMKDYGMDESWTKEYNICLNKPPYFHYPWILTLYGFKTLPTTNNGSTSRYDWNHESYFDNEKDEHVIDIHGLPSRESIEFLCVVAHVGSLVSPKSIATRKEITSDMPSEKHPVAEIHGKQNDWKDISEIKTYTALDLDGEGEDEYENGEDEYEYDEDGFYLLC